MEYRAGGIERLQLVLYVECGEDILRVPDRQMAGVRVIWRAIFIRRDDIRVEHFVVLCKAVGCGFCRSSLQIVEISVLLLIVAQPLPHMVQYVFGKRLRLRVGQIFPEPFRVQPRLIHADKTDRRKMILKRAEIASGIGVEPTLHQLRDDHALRLERTRGDVHQPVEPPVEIRLAFGKIRDPRQVDRHNADRTGRLAGAEEAAGFFAQLPQIKPQAAAHRAHVVRLHVRVDIVGEIRRAVFGRHFKQKLVVFRVSPVKILGDGIGRDGVLEAAPVCIALDHQLNECPVDHVHFLLALAVGERLLLPADDGRKVCHILRHRPVERDVGKRRLRTPARRRIDAVDERLHALLDLTLRQFIHADEGREIGVKRGKGLRACPLVLHDAEEVYHLVAERGQMGGGSGADFPRHAAKPLLNELPEAPSRAVAGEHAEVVQMQLRVPVRLRDLRVVDLAQPVVCRDRAGVGQDQAADGIRDRGILLHAPVVDPEIIVHQLLIIEQGAADVAQLFPLLAVENVGLCHIRIARFAQNALHTVLNILDRDQIMSDLRLKFRRDTQSQQLDHARMLLPANGLKGSCDGIANLGNVKFCDASVSFCYPVHSWSSCSLCAIV